MVCPFCGSARSSVRETRAADGGGIRRRRECTGCGNRYTTYERVGDAPVTVVKRDGRRERFDRQKLLRGLGRAAGGRPVSDEQLEALADTIVASVRRGGPEARAEEIGELAELGLARLDPLTGIQFASVYRNLADLDELEAVVRRFREAGAIPSGMGSSIGLSPQGAHTERRGHARQP